MGALKPVRLDDDPRDGEESPKPCTRANWSGPAVFITFIVLLGLLTTLVPPPDKTVVDMARDVDVALDPSIWETAVQWTGSAQGAREVLEDLDRYHAWILVTKGPNKPTRRADGQPFLTTGVDVALPTATINVAATVLEGALGRKLFGMHMEAVDMTSRLPLITGSLRPYVIWEVGSGLVLVDKDLTQRVWGEPKVQHMIGSMASYLFSAVADSVRNIVQGVGAIPDGTAAGAGDFPQLAGVLGPALAMAVAAAFAAAPPLWFCIVCPAVLGLLAPLVVNIALNQLAGYLCVHMALPDDQCFDLLLGALGLGFVLSLASAIPIFYVCKLQDCAHRDVGSGVPAGRGRGGVSRVWGSLQTLLGRKGGPCTSGPCTD